MDATEALEILERITKFKPIKTGRGHLCICPSHEDNSPSLGVSQSGGRLLLKCFTGCSFIEILHALLAQTTVSVWDENNPNKALYEVPFWEREVVATYDYTDENGEFLYQKVKFFPKSYGIRHKVGKKMGMGYEWSKASFI